MSSIAVKDAEKINSLVWFRNDLRIYDHSGLTHAVQNSNSVIGVYFFNPDHYKINELGFPKTDSFRAQFLIDSVKNLEKKLSELNISLIIKICNPKDKINSIVDDFNISRVYLQDEWTDEETKEEECLKSLKSKIDIYKYSDQFLYHPEDVELNKVPNIFTVFRKHCEKNLNVRSMFPKPNSMDETNLLDINFKSPSLEDLGLEYYTEDSRSAFPFRGGYDEGLKRLNHYLWESKKVSFYKKTRNGLIGIDYSSKFSSWLSNGSLSPRIIFNEIKKYERKIEKNQSTYWMIFELIWRDYFKYISKIYGNSIFKIGGILEKKYEWIKDLDLFQKWIDGETNEPFVNANMIELKKTGWMSNRGRQNVASFLSKELFIDWRWGARYFESKLIDYDVHSNWGNWMYVSGVGNDPRDRKFNIQFQAERYDANKKFQKLWLQEKISLF
ncbi:MAG: DASH family cryptochrome [Flavobacteriaceae bacterium]